MGEPTTVLDLLDADERHSALRFLGVGLGGVLVALQALMSYKRAKAMATTAAAQAEAAKAQAKASEHHATANENTERGQQIDRLKIAIEHLGNPSASVRSGGAVLVCADMTHAKLSETNLSEAPCFKVRLLAAAIFEALG